MRYAAYRMKPGPAAGFEPASPEGDGTRLHLSDQTER